jgi:hypothetical protein
MGRLEVSTGSATPLKESSAKGEALQFCPLPLRQEKSAALLLHYTLQMRATGYNRGVANANKRRENR